MVQMARIPLHYENEFGGVWLSIPFEGGRSNIHRRFIGQWRFLPQ